jgi:hypothetical protein
MTKHPSLVNSHVSINPKIHAAAMSTIASFHPQHSGATQRKRSFGEMASLSMATLTEQSLRVIAPLCAHVGIILGLSA